MSKLDKVIAELRANIEKANSDWETRKAELDQQVNREYGFYVGKVETMKKTLETLTAPDDEETQKNETGLDKSDEGQKSIDQE